MRLSISSSVPMCGLAGPAGVLDCSCFVGTAVAMFVQGRRAAPCPLLVVVVAAVGGCSCRLAVVMPVVVDSRRGRRAHNRLAQGATRRQLRPRRRDSQGSPQSFSSRRHSLRALRECFGSLRTAVGMPADGCWARVDSCGTAAGLDEGSAA